MSLGLSLAFAANPFRLLVSCLGSRERSEGRSWGPKAAGPGVLMGGGAGLKDREQRQPLPLFPCPLGLWPHAAPNLQGEHLCKWPLLLVWIQSTPATQDDPRDSQRWVQRSSVRLEGPGQDWAEGLIVWGVIYRSWCRRVRKLGSSVSLQFSLLNIPGFSSFFF